MPDAELPDAEAVTEASDPEAREPDADVPDAVCEEPLSPDTTGAVSVDTAEPLVTAPPLTLVMVFDPDSVDWEVAGVTATPLCVGSTGRLVT